MLIDDSELDRALYRRVIERSSHVSVVLEFEHGETALEHLRNPDREPVELIFLDINMPCVDGFEFLERAAIELDSTRFGSFVVILTTSRDPRDIERSATFDRIADYCRKPLTDRLFESIVQRLSIKTIESRAHQFSPGTSRR